MQNVCMDSYFTTFDSYGQIIARLLFILVERN